MGNLKKNAILNYSMDMAKYFQTITDKERKEGNLEKATAYEEMIKQEEMVMKSLDLDGDQLIQSHKEGIKSKQKK